MGYFTASVEWANKIGRPDAWKDWWYDPDARIYNFIGKDNIMSRQLSQKLVTAIFPGQTFFTATTMNWSQLGGI
jgi:hypothetical protein